MLYKTENVEGTPLQYHPTIFDFEYPQQYFYQYQPELRNSTFPDFYFHQFYMMNRRNSCETIKFAPSANQLTTTSDSDENSESSSIDVNISEENYKNSNSNQAPTKTKCCWKFCGIEFEKLESLVEHVTKSHSSSGPGGLFYCGWQGCTRNQKGFNARYKMLVHVRTHTNEKPHKCQLCEKSFSRAENLKIHTRTHSGEKPYVCTVEGCNKAYSNSSDRFKHTRTHQIDKPYFCKVPGCIKKYTDPSSLRKHIKTYKHFYYFEENNQNNQIISSKTESNSENVWNDNVKNCEELIINNFDVPLDLSMNRYEA